MKKYTNEIRHRAGTILAGRWHVVTLCLFFAFVSTLFVNHYIQSANAFWVYVGWLTYFESFAYAVGRFTTTITAAGELYREACDDLRNQECRVNKLKAAAEREPAKANSLGQARLKLWKLEEKCKYLCDYRPRNLRYA